MESYPNITYPPANSQEKSTKQNQCSNLYTQTYQCTCSQTFKTLTDYQRHIIDENHQQFQPIPNAYQPTNHNIIAQKHPVESQVIKKYIQNNHSFQPGQHRNNISLQNNEIQNQKWKPSYQQHSQRREQILASQRMQNILSQVNDINFQRKNKQTRIEEKQLSLKYIEAYYRSKLDPFYRQLDIDPEKSFNNQKKSGLHQNSYQFQQMKRKQQNNMPKKSRQGSTKDLNKVLQQLQVRMIPVQNGIIDFLGIFIKENTQRLSKVTEEQVESISIKLQTNLMELHMMCDVNRFNRSKKDQEFMDSDLDLVIGMFIEFLKQILRPNEIWIVSSMLLIVVDSIKQFLMIHQNQLRENLKISDISLLFDTIKSRSQNQQNESSFAVDSQTTCQLLVWFCQWFTMVQYVKNKWNLDFIEPLLYNVHQINYLYQENVIAYQKCSEIKRHQFTRIAKRKLIQKKKKRRIQLEFLEKHRKKYFNDINCSTGDFDTLRCNQKEKEIANRLTQGTTIQSHPTSHNHIQSYLYENQRRQDIAINKVAQKIQNLRVIPESSQMNNLYRGSYNKSKQRVHETPHEGSIIHRSHQLNEQQSQEANSMEDLDSKSLNFSVYQSQFVSYFSPEAQERRKKQNQIWNIKLQQLKHIIDNPNQWKQILKQSVPRQLKQVEQLTNSLQLDLIMINIYKKDLVKTNRSPFLPNEIHLERDPNHNFISRLSESERQRSKPTKIIELQDPFIVLRNYRQNKLINSENSQKILNKYILEEKHERNDPRLNEESEKPHSNYSMWVQF